MEIGQVTWSKRGPWVGPWGKGGLFLSGGLVVKGVSNYEGGISNYEGRLKEIIDFHCPRRIYLRKSSIFIVLEAFS